MAAPLRIEDIVSTVVIPSEIRAGVASIEIQNETYLKKLNLQVQASCLKKNCVKTPFL